MIGEEIAGNREIEFGTEFNSRSSPSFFVFAHYFSPYGRYVLSLSLRGSDYFCRDVYRRGSVSLRNNSTRSLGTGRTGQRKTSRVNFIVPYDLRNVTLGR